MFRLRHDQISSLAGALCMITLMSGGVLFWEARTAFWWCFVVNEVIGYIALMIWTMRNGRGEKTTLVMNAVFCIFIASFWLPMALHAYGYHKQNMQRNVRSTH